MSFENWWEANRQHFWQILEVADANSVMAVLNDCWKDGYRNMEAENKRLWEALGWWWFSDECVAVGDWIEAEEESWPEAGEGLQWDNARHEAWESAAIAAEKFGALVQALKDDDRAGE